MSRFIWTLICRCGVEFADTDAFVAVEAFELHSYGPCRRGLSAWKKRRHDGLLVRS